MELIAGAPALLTTVLLLGLVHGFDWDHIAAISDMTGTVSARGRAFWLATMYVLGHALVVLVLGIGAILLGLALPEWVDTAMERVVGVTLIFLAVWLIYSLFHDGADFQLRSRWMLAFDGIRGAWVWLTSLVRGMPRRFEVRRGCSYGTGTALAVGMLHGIGAETGTQALLFLAVAGAGGEFLGGLMLAAFISGLVMSNSIITVTSLLGFRMAARGSATVRMVGALVAVFSLVLGVLFVSGQGTLLPTIIGWEPTF